MDWLDDLAGINDPLMRRARWLNERGDSIAYAACVLSLIACLILLVSCGKSPADCCPGAGCTQSCRK